MQGSQTLEELRESLKHSILEDILDNVGMVPNIHVTQISDKEKAYKMIKRYVLYDSQIFLIEELKQGLKTLGILDCLQKYPIQFSDIFCKRPTPLDAQTVDLLFSPRFSEEGSNARSREEQAIVFWRDYLQDAGGKN